MKKILRGRLTYANVMATIAVFLVLGGGAYAASQLPKNSVGAKQLRNGAITPRKLSAGAKKALRGATGPKGAAGKPGKQGAQGKPGKEGPAGTALGYALVQENGTVDSGGSSGITSADVARESTGTYCFDRVPAGTKSVVATANGQGAEPVDSDRFVSVSFVPLADEPGLSGCASIKDLVRVTVFDLSDEGLADSAFTIWFED
jgi:hypothetical protein